MMKNFAFLCMLSFSSLYAHSFSAKEQIKVPHCLAIKLSSTYPILAENKAFKIIEVPTKDLNKISLIADQIHCGRFINVSQHFTQNPLQKNLINPQDLLHKKRIIGALKSNRTYKINHHQAVKTALAKIEANNIWDILSYLTSYPNRAATQETGVETAYWLKTAFEKMVIEAGHEDTASYFVKAGEYQQPSLVTVIGQSINAPAIVLGAHMDTLEGLMPGAGDDGSGCASMMEMARVLLNSPQSFKRPIYFIWYAAEERGLTGSQYVVRDFLQKSIAVQAAIQFDMTGFRFDPQDPTMWIFRDYTDKPLNDFVAELIKTYIKVPVSYSQCGYGCSDHVSWNEVDVPVAFPCESSFENHNPTIHSSADSMALLNLEHMTNFTKLGLAFAIELASE